MHTKRSRSLLAATALAAVATLSACQDAVSPGAEGPMAVSFAVAPSGSSSASAAGAGPLFSVSAAAGRAVQIQQVDLVLARVHLGRVRGSEECEEKSADCAPVKAGPVLVSLPLTGGTVSPFTALPPAGVYDRLHFHIHRPEGSDSTTAAFRAANTGWPESASVRVKGTFDAGDGQGAQPFDVFLRSSAHLKQRIDPPVELTADTDPASLGVTVTVDVDSWFTGRDGSVIDPRALATDKRLLSQVERNIRDSFRALSHKKDMGREKEKEDRGNRGKSGK